MTWMGLITWLLAIIMLMAVITNKSPVLIMNFLQLKWLTYLNTLRAWDEFNSILNLNQYVYINT